MKRFRNSSTNVLSPNDTSNFIYEFNGKNEII